LENHYRVSEFAELAGVTVKTLHHYDRLGLLRPRRTSAGYRVYTPADLEPLKQIVALKFLGLTLKQIKILAGADSFPLAEALRRQRQVLESKRQRLDRAIRAIEQAEAGIHAGPSARAGVLKTLIEVIELPEELDVTWTKRREWPAGLKRYVASLYEMTFEEWDRVASWIEASDQQAIAS
jgi:DNA-binding transcriptional MerR regulator